MLVCPNCRKEFKKGNKYCSECGSLLVKLLLDIDESFLPQEVEEEISAAVVVCPKCGGVLNEIANYCCKCGERLAEIIEEKKPQAIIRCANCSAENEASNIKCKVCGSDLKKDTSELFLRKQEKIKQKEPLIKEDDIEKKQVVAKLTSYESIKLEDTSAIKTPQMIKCPHCNFLQEIGQDKCKKCGFLLAMPTPEISQVDLIEKEAKREIPETKEISRTKKQVIAPIIPKKIAKKSIIEEIKDSFINFIATKYGIGAAAIIILAIIGIIIFNNISMKNKTKAKESKEVPIISIFLDKIEVGEFPAIIKGYSEFNLTTSVPVNVYIDDKDYGMTPIKGLLIPSGYHDLRLKNEEYLIDEIQNIYVIPGVPFERNLTLGHFGSLNINAIPWADVYIDGKYVGQTPIANLKVVIGAHEILFKNSKFPNRRRNISIEEGTTTDITVDMNYNQ